MSPGSSGGSTKHDHRAEHVLHRWSGYLSRETRWRGARLSKSTVKLSTRAKGRQLRGLRPHPPRERRDLVVEIARPSRDLILELTRPARPCPCPVPMHAALARYGRASAAAIGLEQRRHELGLLDAVQGLKAGHRHAPLEIAHR